MSDRRMFSAREESVHEIFSENRYEIPYYQRPYSWLKDNAVAIWDDLHTAWQEEGFDGAGYFLGSVVLVKSKDREEIVDDQQRFITLQLLLSAIAHNLEDSDKRRKLTRYFI